MGKRVRNKEVKAERRGPKLVKDESKAADSSRRVSSSTVVKAGSDRKNVAGKVAASQYEGRTSFKEGGPGSKIPLAWTPAKEIIALAELFKSMNVDAGQPLDTSNIDWEQLATKVGQRLNQNLTRIQIYEKARRLKERYVRIHKQVGEGQPITFKNEDEEGVYKLSQQIWGSSEAQPHQEKLLNVANMHEGDSLPGAPGGEIPGETVEKESAPKMSTRSSSEPKEGTTATHTHANPDSNFALESKIDASMERDTQKTLEMFQAEQQALLKQLEKSCVTVLQNMQSNFLSMMNNTVRGSPFASMGGGGGFVSVFDYTEGHFSWDKLVNKCLYSATSTDKPSAFESLYEQWQQQRLQELKLTSMKLQLMLENCKMEQEKLERQVLEKAEKS